MATMLDHQLGLKKETTWNTPVTVDRFYEWLPGNGLNWDPMVVQGKGLHVGSQVDRGGRRVGLVGKGSGKTVIELASKSMGTLLEGCWGTGVSTLADASTTYQQLFTAVITGTYLNGYTLQEGIVYPGTTTNVDAYTYSGCTVKSFEIDMPSDGIGTLSVEWDARSLATGTALATASYVSAPTLYAGGLPATGAMTYGGTLTVPTTTVLASVASGTAVAIKKWTLTVNNNVDDARDVIGGRNQPTVGLREIKLKATVEYDTTTGSVFRDAQINQSGAAILIDATTAESLSTGTAELQLALPACYVDDGAIPVPSEGATVTTDITFSVLDNLTDVPAYMVLRTADTAL